MNPDPNLTIPISSQPEANRIGRWNPLPALGRGVLTTFSVLWMSLMVLPATVPVMRVTPDVTRRPPVQPATRVDILEKEMRAAPPPASAKPGVWRVAGVVHAVGNGGVLLISAGAVAWAEVALQMDGAIESAIVPGAKMQPKHGFVQLIGSYGKVGEHIEADTQRAGIQLTQVGRKTLQVPRFRILPAGRIRGGD